MARTGVTRGKILGVLASGEPLSSREVILETGLSRSQVYKGLRAVVEGFNGRAKSRLAYQRLTWQGLDNAGIHVGLVLMVVYTVCIAAYGIGRPELRQSVAFFA